MADIEAAASSAKSGRGKLLAIIAVPVLLGVGGAGGWWFFGRSGHSADEAQVVQKPAVFVPMEAFTVNLVPENGQQQYAQIGLNLKVADQDTADALKDRAPEVRNRILLLISSKRASELIQLNGKRALADDIMSATMAIISPETATALKKAGAKPVTVARAPAATRTDTADPQEGEEPQGEEADEAAEKKRPASRGKSPPTVIEVLFTAFIIQ